MALRFAALTLAAAGVAAQQADQTCTIASIGGDPDQVGVDDLLALLANYGRRCNGDTCAYVPRRITVHFDGVRETP